MIIITKIRHVPTIHTLLFMQNVCWYEVYTFHFHYGLPIIYKSTVSADNELFADTVSANNELFADTVSANNKLFADTVSANNFYLF